MIDITLCNASLTYLGDEQPIFSNLNMTLGSGSCTAVLGPSGCGKSTLLRYVAGLLNDQVTFTGQLTSSSEAGIHNQIAYMAQQDLLMPWLSVIDNVCLASRLRGVNVTPDITERALFLLASVGLKDKAYDKTTALSGGQKQRVALARTLMQNKPIVLMDEPFSALDAVTRYKLQNLASSLLADKTVLLITHDPQEALRLGHQILVMNGKPATLFPITAPTTAVPREIDAQFAALQQQILKRLEGADDTSD
ncbi:hydrogenase expression protein [Vibrio sp. 10N.286.49.C2]|uniref:ABC transporter ATP-binding protein n=1 Tax=unclassified Vibrio TaxID=2614977 RepID=UPI000C82306B|nr:MULTISPECIES: ABC transporter ATP-binding protein [unclassified Vibrio]PMH33300.1 hydrogenase expression protein [Vibrio sp. 10N.286.49.C2]PMH48197.1 hydrogenase expression protein [Vibrio sp. 10N.286.49.B1]PMH82407.1 hydrogenase expression protein [Vibrio sp. 10N.286.48.B7]